jgi:integrase
MALENDRNGLSYKHRAIGTLLYYTGMRCSDICGLTLDSIDLQHHVIRSAQQKTGNSVEIPLSAVVGNALVDYCVHDRPATDSPYLFVTDRAPHRRLIKGGVQWTVIRIMEVAGIRQGEEDRKGGHIFRHRAISRMAEKNIPAPVISVVVGHVSSKALDPYLYTDMKHIRECALGLEKYPMAEEVFSYV